LEMEHKTVVGFYLPSDEFTLDQVADKVAELGKRLVQEWHLYNWGFREAGGDFVVDQMALDQKFRSLVQLLRSVGVDEDGGWILTNVPASFTPEPEIKDRGFDVPAIDLEEGRIEFENSFSVRDDGIAIYLNTEQCYSSEIETRLGNVLGSTPIGIAADMNDVEGDYFEFEV